MAPLSSSHHAPYRNLSGPRGLLPFPPIFLSHTSLPHCLFILLVLSSSLGQPALSPFLAQFSLDSSGCLSLYSPSYLQYNSTTLGVVLPSFHLLQHAESHWFDSLAPHKSLTVPPLSAPARFTENWHPASQNSAPLKAGGRDPDDTGAWACGLLSRFWLFSHEVSCLICAQP